MIEYSNIKIVKKRNGFSRLTVYCIDQHNPIINRSPPSFSVSTVEIFDSADGHQGARFLLLYILFLFHLKLPAYQPHWHCWHIRDMELDGCCLTFHLFQYLQIQHKRFGCKPLDMLYMAKLGKSRGQPINSLPL